MMMYFSFLVLWAWVGLACGWALCWGMVKWNRSAEPVVIPGRRLALMAGLVVLAWLLAASMGGVSHWPVVGLPTGLGVGVWLGARALRRGTMREVRGWAVVLGLAAPMALYAWHGVYLSRASQAVSQGLREQAGILERVNGKYLEESAIAWNAGPEQGKKNHEAALVLGKLTKLEDIEALAPRPMATAILDTHRQLELFRAEAAKHLAASLEPDSLYRPDAMRELSRWVLNDWDSHYMHFGMVRPWVEWTADGGYVNRGLLEIIAYRYCLEVMVAAAKRKASGQGLPRSMDDFGGLGVGLMNLGQETPVVTLENDQGMVTVRVRPPTGMSPVLERGKGGKRMWDVKMMCDFDDGGEVQGDKR